MPTAEPEVEIRPRGGPEAQHGMYDLHTPEGDRGLIRLSRSGGPSVPAVIEALATDALSPEENDRLVDGALDAAHRMLRDEGHRVVQAVLPEGHPMVRRFLRHEYAPWSYRMVKPLPALPPGQGRGEGTTGCRRAEEAEERAWAARFEEAHARELHRVGLSREAARASSRAMVANVPARFELWLTTAGEETTGHVCLAAWPGEQDRTVFVYDLAVEPRFRGLGHGSTLLRVAEEVARARGADHLTLNVSAGNRAALGLYASAAFTRTQVHLGRFL
ncbi:GNAT family N-acetyltransferase [Streptomyces bacillaris]|uniref:GNAT family N-acetyltransferase n=1 Tax=Streptomyces bacillaris TaxID=68179 RepID=UPI0036A76778